MTTGLLIIASIVASLLVANSVYPAIARTSSSVVQMSDKMSERIETQVSIVYATGELNSSHAWTDVDGDGKFDVTAWVKNVGSSRILGADQMDVFLGQQGAAVTMFDLLKAALRQRHNHIIIGEIRGEERNMLFGIAPS